MFTPKGRVYPGGRSSRSNTPLSGSTRRTGPLLTTRLKTSGSTPVSRSQCVESTVSHLAQVWGSSLPVLVTEVLTLSSDCATEVTVSLGNNGWAWLVSGRRLVIWRYRAGGGRSTQCRELSLPPSDLAHRAELCLVYSPVETGLTPCCLAVSPEGVIRYWPSIAQEGSSTEISAELGGQECFSLTDIHPVGSLLATTTSTLVLIHHSGQSLACRRLTAPTGLLGGLGRRVSSLLYWGAGAATGGVEARMVRVGARLSLLDQEEVDLFVLTNNGLQKWQLAEGEQDKLYYECDVASLAREAMWGALGKEEGSSAWLRLWLLDLSFGQEGQVAVLVAGVDQNETGPMVQYGVAQVKCLTGASPLTLSSFCLLPSLTSPLGDGEEPKSHKLITLDNWAFVHNGEGVQLADLQGAQAETENKVATQVLGAGQVDGVPLFFSSHHGVISLTQAKPQTPEESLVEDEESLLLDRGASRLSDSLNISVSTKGLENLTMSESLTDQLKAAFLQFCKRSTAQAQSIVEELFPAETLSDPVDSTLDRLAVGLSKDLIDDFPASDPRWVESLPQGSSKVGVGSSMSLLVLHQLEDKLACNQFFITFLKSVGLWSRLAGVTLRGQAMSTAAVLAEHAEKTVGAVTLRTLHQDHQAVMDAAIRACLADREVTASGNLTDQDHFYREISRVDDIVSCLVGVVRFSVRSDTPRDLLANLVSVNTVVITLIKECLAARNKRISEFLVETSTKYEYLPWTSTKRGQLVDLVKLSLEQGVAACEEGGQRVSLYRQVVDLVDLVLDGFTCQLASLTEGSEKHSAVSRVLARDRASLVGSLVDRKVYEEAASLAEKYQEFDMLVRICEETGNQARLESYMEQFSEQQFSKHVFAWFVKEGKQSRLLSLPKAGQSSVELSSFLSHHEDISWLHDIHTKSFGQAGETLKEIGLKEADLLSRKKTQLSLAKLAILASDVSDQELQSQLDVVEQDMSLVAAQEQLPSSVLGQFGFDRESMRVLSPREMIELYIGEENVEADHIDFKKALDLLNFAVMDSSERQNTWLHIWCRSVLRNSWTDIDVDNPVESVKDTVFFRLVEFAFMQGADLREYLPSVQGLLDCEELGDLRENQNFQYLIQSGYEHIQKVCAY